MSSPSGSSNSDYAVNTALYTPKSPAASSLTQYIDYPVSLYTGVPQISIPIYVIETDGVSVPISLSYHASGIRASQESTSVGLGWSLNAGGGVFRTIKCGDDFNEYPSYSGLYKGYIDTPDSIDMEEFFRISYTGMTPHYVLVEDSEPDIFFFSLPGASGKFLLNRSHEAVLFDKDTNVRVCFSESGGFHSFCITTPDGTQYHFSLCETTMSYSRDGYLNKNSTNSYIMDENEYRVNTYYNSPSVYTSSWLLTEIRTPHNRSVNFTYQPEKYQLPAMESVIKRNIVEYSGEPSLLPTDLVNYHCGKTVIDGYRLSGITWDSGSVTMTGSVRDDILSWDNGASPRRIDDIRVYDSNDSLVVSYHLGYGYFNQGSTSYPQVYKRLRLDSVIDMRDPNKRYVLDYYPGTLPPKNTNNTDFWGFPNGINQGAEYYCALQTPDGRVYPGADKAPVLSEARKGALRSITSPTGNTTEFIYELNTFRPTGISGTVTRDKHLGLSVYNKVNYDEYPDLSQYNASIVEITRQTSFTIIGYAEDYGSSSHPEIEPTLEANSPFRIKRVLADGSTEDCFSFQFPSALASGTESSHTFSAVKTLSGGKYLFEAFSAASDVWFSFGVDYAVTEQTDTCGGYGGGLRVREISGPARRTFAYGNGRLLVSPVYSYQQRDQISGTTDNSLNVLYDVQCSTPTIPMCTLKGGYSVGYDRVSETKTGWNTTITQFHNIPETEMAYDYPFLSPAADYMNGLPLMESVTDGSTELQRISYEYTTRTAPQIKAFEYREFGSLVEYSYNVEWPLLASRTTTHYETNGSISSREEYSYNDWFQLSETLLETEGDCYAHRIKYATDFQDAVSHDMVSRHMIGVPLEKTMWKNGHAVKGRKTEYVLSGCLVLPSREYFLEASALLSSQSYSNAFKERLSISEYTSRGNPMQLTADGQTKVLLWSYSQRYVIAEIANATFSEVSSALGSSFIAELADKTSPTAADYLQIRGLQDSLPHSMVSTYTYKPLAGLASETSPSGLTWGYGYDTSGRLSERYYMSGNTRIVVDKYKYHYKDKQ